MAMLTQLDEFIEEIRLKEGIFKSRLMVLFFKDGKFTIAYSPTLDLSGYGNNADEAMETLGIVLDEYLLSFKSKEDLDQELSRRGFSRGDSASIHQTGKVDHSLLPAGVLFHQIPGEFSTAV